MLDAEQLDCVDIATHDVTHTGLVSLAAGRGLHVLCQKPLAPTLAEARAMVELTARAGVRFMVMEMWRHLKPVRDMKRYLDQGIIGPVYALRLLAPPRVLRRTRPIDDQQPYLADLPKLMVYDTYIHHIDGIRYLLGDVTSVYARMSRTNPAIVGEDRLFLMMGHASGATSSIDASWVVPVERPTKLHLGDFLIEGVDGALHLDSVRCRAAPRDPGRDDRAGAVRIEQPRRRRADWGRARSTAASPISRPACATIGRSSRRRRTT